MGRFGNLNCDMTSTRIPNFYSLFSGCGGLDLGFVQAGFVPRLSVDQDANALAVHSAHLACPVQKLDLAASDPSIPQSARIDVLLAGSPCQGFSTLGQRRVDDPRNSLLLVASRLAAKHRPKVVVAENVLGALSGEHRLYWEAPPQPLPWWWCVAMAPPSVWPILWRFTPRSAAQSMPLRNCGSARRMTWPWWMRSG